jgi:hypothetical protein
MRNINMDSTAGSMNARRLLVTEMNEKHKHGQYRRVNECS